MTIKYAIYPGSVTTYSGEVLEFTAEELAVLYGVDDEDYLEVTDEAALLSSEASLEYIHLKPRRDNQYFDQKDADHDQSDSLIGKDFDGNRLYTQETVRPYNHL